MDENQIIVLDNVRSDALAKRAQWIAERDVLAVEAAAVTVVNSDAMLEVAGKLQTQISKHIKALDKARKDITEPLDAVKGAIMQQQREMVANLQAELDRLKAINSTYATTKSAAAEEARRKAELEARIAAEAAFKRQQDAEAERLAAEDRAYQEQQAREQKAKAMFGPAAVVAPPPPVVVAPVPVAPPHPPAAPVFVPAGPKTTANRFVEVWQFEILDAAQVPREFCSPNEQLIRKWLAYQKSLGTEISSLQADGLRLFKITTVGSK